MFKLFLSTFAKQAALYRPGSSVPARSIIVNDVYPRDATSSSMSIRRFRDRIADPSDL